MRTTLKKDFELPQPSEVVWEYLIDPYKIVECVPGVTLTEDLGDNKYKGDVGLKLGPVNAAFNGDISFDKIDKENHDIILTGKGVDKKGKGTAEMSLEMHVVDQGETTMVETVMNVNVVGVIAQFGSRLINDVSDHIFKQFVTNFQNLLAGEEISEADKNISGGKVVGTALKSMVSGVFGKKKSEEESE